MVYIYQPTLTLVASLTTVKLEATTQPSTPIYLQTVWLVKLASSATLQAQQQTPHALTALLALPAMLGQQVALTVLLAHTVILQANRIVLLALLASLALYLVQMRARHVKYVGLEDTAMLGNQMQAALTVILANTLQKDLLPVFLVELDNFSIKL